MVKGRNEPLRHTFLPIDVVTAQGGEREWKDDWGGEGRGGGLVVELGVELVGEEERIGVIQKGYVRGNIQGQDKRGRVVSQSPAQVVVSGNSNNRVIYKGGRGNIKARGNIQGQDKRTKGQGVSHLHKWLS